MIHPSDHIVINIYRTARQFRTISLAIPKPDRNGQESMIIARSVEVI